MEVVTISPHDLNALHSRGRPVELIDVRTPLEYREMHIPFARNVPLSDIDPAFLTQNRIGSADEPLYFVCRSGRRVAPIPRRSFEGSALPAAAVRPSPLFLGDLLEHLLVQSQLSNETLEPFVLDL